MRNVLFILTISILLIGCGGDKRLDEKLEREKLRDLVKDNVITNDERLDMAGYIACIKIKNVSDADKIIKEKTISEILSLSKEYKKSIYGDPSKAEDQNMFETYRAVVEMTFYFKAELVNAINLHRMDNYWAIKVRLINISNEAIKAVKAVYLISDAFGDQIGKFILQDNNGLLPSDTAFVTSEQAFINNENLATFRKGIKSENFKELNLQLWPIKLMLANGRIIDSKQEFSQY